MTSIPTAKIHMLENRFPLWSPPAQGVSWSDQLNNLGTKDRTRTRDLSKTAFIASEIEIPRTQKTVSIVVALCEFNQFARCLYKARFEYGENKADEYPRVLRGFINSVTKVFCITPGSAETLSQNAGSRMMQCVEQISGPTELQLTGDVATFSYGMYIPTTVSKKRKGSDLHKIFNAFVPRMLLENGLLCTAGLRSGDTEPEDILVRMNLTKASALKKTIPELPTVGEFDRDFATFSDHDDATEPKPSSEDSEEPCSTIECILDHIIPTGSKPPFLRGVGGKSWSSIQTDLSRQMDRVQGSGMSVVVYLVQNPEEKTDAFLHACMVPGNAQEVSNALVQTATLTKGIIAAVNSVGYLGTIVHITPGQPLHCHLELSMQTVCHHNCETMGIWVPIFENLVTGGTEESGTATYTARIPTGERRPMSFEDERRLGERIMAERAMAERLAAGKRLTALAGSSTIATKGLTYYDPTTVTRTDGEAALVDEDTADDGETASVDEDTTDNVAARPVQQDSVRQDSVRGRKNRNRPNSGQ
jgi:hypothetical protein